MTLMAKLAPLAVLTAAGLAASGLPPVSPVLDFTYDSEPNLTIGSYSPGGAVITSPQTDFLIRYGTPSGGGSPAQIETFDLGSADWCYGTACGTPTNPYTFPLGSIELIPNSIVAGTGISSINGNFTVNGTMAQPSTPPGQPTYPISVSDAVTIFTGLDPGGATQYLYLENADGTFTNILHVTVGSSGADVALTGELIDPPGSLTFDVTDFSGPVTNGFLTAAPTPEPSTWALAWTAIAIGAGIQLRRTRHQARVD